MNNGHQHRNGNLLKRSAAVFKEGPFSKVIPVEINIYDSGVAGYGLGVYRDEETAEESLVQYSFDYRMEEVSEVREAIFKKTGSLELEAQSGGRYGDKPKTLLLPNLTDTPELVELIRSTKAQYLLQKDEETKLMAMEREKEQQLQYDQQEYFDKIYAFHITEKKRPFYIFHHSSLYCAALYIGDNKSLNFLVIDGRRMQETNASIAYQDIHYYERAGAIHYTTNIQSEITSFGGSFVGGDVSAGAAILGGLLLGPMGMAAGAMLTHTPTAFTAPDIRLDIRSSPNRVDDRSVILNHYSVSHGQFIDIELPAGIYNFLQTHLSEKKYDVVIELEKQSAVNQLGAGTGLVQAGGIPSPAESLDAFKVKVDKLLYMKECGIITNEEFEAEKKRLLQSL
ncbi:MAG: hypothetical protein K0Q90_2415 [Paenibacillaceae bacterium]|jgi:hypothetical protein|nr:hypothetical protein [Paenibacillaceae bacterium]